MMKIIFLSVFWTYAAIAGLPPTTSKLSSDSANVTTFNYLFPNFTGTHTGPTVSLGVNSVVGGGTGAATLTNHGVLLGQGTSAVAATAAGSSGQVLQSGGASANPAYSTATYPSTAGTSGNVLTSDGTNWTSAAPGATSSLVKSYNITSHGFAVNDVVYCTATTTCAKATAAANNDAADPIGIVTAVADANNFTVTYAGYASTLTGKTANTVYALSNTTAGLLVVDGSETCTTGTVHRVMLKTDSTTSGWVSNAPGTVCTGAVTPTTTSWAAYTPTFGGFGTPTNVSFFWRRTGDTVEVWGTMNLGTCTAALGTVSLPNSYTIDTTKIPTANTSANPGLEIGQAIATSANQNAPIVLAASTSTSVVYTGSTYNVAAHLTPTNANAVWTNGTFISMHFSFPISGP